MKKLFAFNSFTVFYSQLGRAPKTNSNLLTQKGFTLVELLIVMAILGILAVGLIAAIDPVDKLNAASDAKVVSAIGTMARATESFVTSNNGFYPAGTANLTSSGELKNVPAAPTGYTAYVFTPLPAACTSGTTCTSVTISGQLKSKKSLATSGAATAVAKYESTTGKQCIVATASTACP